MIERLSLEGASVSGGGGSVYVGLMAGYNEGTVRGCMIQGEVLAGEDSMAVGGAVGFHTGLLYETGIDSTVLARGEFLGGLVGYNQGRIDACRVVTQVVVSEDRRPGEIGGIAGRNAGVISNCYVRGELYLNIECEDFGPFVGSQVENGSRFSSHRASSTDGLRIDRQFSWIDRPPASLHRYYAVVEIAGGNIDPRDGHSFSGDITNCLWSDESAGDYVSPFGIALSSEEMQDPEILGLNGWAQDPNWMLAPGDFPRLAWEGTPGETIPEPALDWLAGVGTQADPHLIESDWALQRIGACGLLWDRHFRLVADLDLSGWNWRGWGPNPWAAFAGTLDGNGHRITHLTVERAYPRSDFIGLFGVLNPSAVVRDLVLRDCSIVSTGRLENAGCLAGRNGGVVYNCDVTGQVDIQPDCSSVGIVAGENTGSLLFCRVQGTIGVGEKAYEVGGCTGDNNGSIIHCQVDAEVHVGASSRYVGGLAGSNREVIANSLARGQVVAGPESRDIGGMVGSNYGAGTFCYWNADLLPDSLSILGRGLSTVQMKEARVYGLNGWGDAPAWVLDEGRDYPRLVWEGTPGGSIPVPEIDWLAGGGTADDPHLIDTPDQLGRLGSAGILWDRHYILTGDLDMTGTQHLPIGLYPGSGFSGSFDGRGHAIRNLSLTASPPLSSYLGLFGRLDSGGSVLDLRLSGVSLDLGAYGWYVGPLAGSSAGSVARCGAAGLITGTSNWRVGGLIGENTGSVDRCSARVDLNLRLVHSAGGLAGRNEGIIQDAYASSRVDTGEGSQRIGGLVGNNRGTLNHCYATGHVQGEEWVGGLAGADMYGGRYLTPDAYFLSPEDGGGPDNEIGTALSRAAMQQAASYPNWDFEDIWSIDEGVDFPRLQWE